MRPRTKQIADALRSANCPYAVSVAAGTRRIRRGMRLRSRRLRAGYFCRTRYAGCPEIDSSFS